VFTHKEIIMLENTRELTPDQIAFTVPTVKIRELRMNGEKKPIIGQDRAITALNLGLGIKADGYNIFIMGSSGTGRRTVLTTLLADYKANPADLQDIAYVCNFPHPLEPKALLLQAGEGAAFRKGLQSTIESIRKQVLQLSKSEAFLTTRKKIIASADSEENQMLSEFESKMVAEGFKLFQVKDDESRSMDLAPMIRGKTVTFEELQSKTTEGKFPAEKLNALRERYYRCLDQMSELFVSVKEKRHAADKQIRTLKTELAIPIIDTELAALKTQFEASPSADGLKAHLAALREDLVSRVHSYSEPFKSAAHKKGFFGRYAVNVICEHTKDGTNIVQEEVPTFANLFGSIEAVTGNEDASINGHLRLRAGAVHRAFGGFLVLRLQDLLMEEGTWLYLKRVLQSGKVEIQTPPTGNHAPSILKPQTLPAKLKVIVIGGENSYDFLYQEDPDFQKLFKVCAEFDSVMPCTDENMAKFITFIDALTDRQKTLPVDDSGIARILSYAARVSEYRNMLTTRFTLISDLITEADYHARMMQLPVISAEVISRTIEHRRYLHKLPDEKYSLMIESREIVLDVTGTAIGKVNGLAVHDRGYHAFGIPVAVTAQASPGNKGVINIERESGLSGEIYDKAHLIIQGLLHRKYARNIPLALSASICFEQSYTEVDGDSASCASFFALLSAIAQIPLRQDIAVTGSLNQLGDVQPVGGIQEKIEGFFDTCSILGLTGTQGVIIPVRNLNNVLPSERVQQAISDGLFHIWAISSVEDGLEVLSGLPAIDFERKVADTLTGYASQMHDNLNDYTG
jgi:lon-related putative ATP-dependent protease